MIPKRVKLSGFLCYRDEQELGFDGKPLWMLAGLNGSGKSAVFDALTYALFGYHRGGSTGAVELITKGENNFNLEFDFALDGQLYRAKRTLRKRAVGTAATQQLMRWQADAEAGQGEWQPVADTQLKARFDDWIRDHIGLNYETFTSSVLLLQGQAEKLLDQTAKGRAEVLASIVDLERYQKLHEKADTQRKTLKGQVDALTNQWNAIPEVTEWERQTIANEIDAAEAEHRKAQLEADRLQALEFHARQWSEVEKKLASAKQRRQAAHTLVQEADSIDKDLKRLRELRDALPHVETVVLNRATVSTSQETTKQLTSHLRETRDSLNNREFELEQARRKRESLQANIVKKEAEQQEIGKKMLPLSAMLERVKLIDQRTDEMNRLNAELALLPAELPKKVEDGQAHVDQLAALASAISPLTRFCQLRSELKLAQDHNSAAQLREKTIQTKGEQIRVRLDGQRPEVDEAKSALKTAQDKLASEKALLKQATELARDFDSLEGAKVCRTCGQRLTPKHFDEEKARREKDRTAAEARSKKATTACKAAEADHLKKSQAYATLEQEIQQAREEYQKACGETQQATKDIGRLTAECSAAYGELPADYRQRASADPPTDWLKTVYPNAADLETAKRTAGGLLPAKAELATARNELTRWSSLNAQLAAAKQAHADLTATLTASPAELRRQFVALETETKAAADLLKAMKLEEKSVATEIDRLMNECQEFQNSITDRTTRLQGEEEKRAMCERSIAAARKALTPDWQAHADRLAMAEWNRLRSEKDELEQKGIEARAGQLNQARIDLESLKQTTADLEKERDQFPDEARRDPNLVQAELKEARGTVTAKADDLNSARNDRSNLEERNERRQSVRTQLDETEREWNRFKLLAELLGRDRLQRHLVRQAERQIVDYANGVLDRLSGGELMLRLCGADDEAGADKALELECYNRATGDSPFNIAFLSGSQRFRVAVSLALGIGQYASRRHRPIESVIIDEGFGCLDRHGRQVMIQELQNLRGHLHCILLVSHQEEFADAFADGYRFELHDGTTRVTRFHR